MIVEALTALEDILVRRRVLPIELVDLLEVLFPGLDLLAASLLHGSFIVAGFFFVIVVGGLDEGILVGEGEWGFHSLRVREIEVGRSGVGARCTTCKLRDPLEVEDGVSMLLRS